MKRHVQVPGIRQWAAEDFLELQSEPLRAIDGFFGQYSPCVLKGCNLTDNGNGTYNLTAGLVTLPGTDAAGNRTFKVVPFSGLIGTPMPVYLTLAYSLVERQYVDGATKPIAYDYHAVATVVKPVTIPFLELKTDNIPRFEDVIQDSSHRFMTDEERDKLLHATTYIHPKTHPASMIVFDDGETLQYKYDLSQQVTYEYTLEVTPASLAFGATGEVKGLSVSSFRTKFVGGVSTEEREQINYTAAVISGTDAFSIQDVAVTAIANNTEASRSGAILVTQEGSGKTVTVSLSQVAGDVTWEYAFSVVPMSLDYTNTVGSKVVNVVSNKQKKINGINSGSPVSVGFTSAVSSGADVFSVDSNTISAVVNNTEAQRSGSVTFTQAESNWEISVSLTQAAGDVTWEYTLSVTPKSLSFDYSGGTKDVSVTSYKRKYINGTYTGEQINIGCSSSVSGTGFSSSGTSVSAGQNNTLFGRSGTATFTQAESGRSASVSLSQTAGVEGWNYTFSVSPTSLSFDTVGGTKAVSVTSYRRQTINGSETGIQENIGYSSSTPGDGFSANGASVSVGQNNSLSGRSGTATFTQAESGRSASVSLSQAAGIEGWNYTFSVSPTSLSFEATGGTKSVSVTSYRRQTINGSETGIQENIGYSSSTSGDGFSANGASVSVGQNNSLSGRSGTATFTQAESGRSASVSLSQAAGIEGWNYTFSVSPASLSFEAEGGTKSVSVISYRRQTINGSETGVQENVGYSVSTTGSGFTNSGNNITASSNPFVVPISGSVIVTQDTSGKTSSVSLEQLGKITATTKISCSKLGTWSDIHASTSITDRVTLSSSPKYIEFDATSEVLVLKASYVKGQFGSQISFDLEGAEFSGKLPINPIGENCYINLGGILSSQITVDITDTSVYTASSSFDISNIIIGGVTVKRLTINIDLFGIKL